MSFFWHFSRVEERRGDAFMRVPFPLPANQTGRAVFPHPAFRQASSRGTRRRHFTHAVQHKHARVPIDLTRKPSDATAGRIMSSAQKGEHAVEDVSINGLMGRGKRTIAEVSGPAAQKAVQSCLHFGPRALIARRQQLADLPLNLRSNRRKLRMFNSTTTPGDQMSAYIRSLHSVVSCQQGLYSLS